MSEHQFAYVVLRHCGGFDTAVGDTPEMHTEIAKLFRRKTVRVERVPVEDVRHRLRMCEHGGSCPVEKE